MTSEARLEKVIPWYNIHLALSGHVLGVPTCEKCSYPKATSLERPHGEGTQQDSEMAQKPQLFESSQHRPPDTKVYTCANWPVVLTLCL